MAYDINWFANNMQAFGSPGCYGCSFCCFRNLKAETFCNKLKCFDCRTGDFVFWGTKISGRNREILMGRPPREMIEWFVQTPLEQSEQISSDIIKKVMERYR